MVNNPHNYDRARNHARCVPPSLSLSSSFPSPCPILLPHRRPLTYNTYTFRGLAKFLTDRRDEARRCAFLII